MEWSELAENTIIKRKILRDEIKDYLMEAILDGRLKPGERIVETQVARHLGVSQAPVREALRELEHVGLLRSVPFKGTYVKKLTDKEIKERYIVRAALEEAASRYALEKITDDVLSQLKKLIEKMVECAKENDFKQMVHYDVEFHRLIVKSAQNDFLLNTWENCSPGSWTRISAHLKRKELLELARRHNEILDALRSGNPEKAGIAIRKHIEELAPNG